MQEKGFIAPYKNHDNKLGVNKMNLNYSLNSLKDILLPNAVVETIVQAEAKSNSKILDISKTPCIYIANFGDYIVFVSASGEKLISMDKKEFESTAEEDFINKIKNSAKKVLELDFSNNLNGGLDYV